MENIDAQFETKIIFEEDILLIWVSGSYTLTKAKSLFKLAIDNALLHNKPKVLIDVTHISGSIPFFDRFEFSEFLALYRITYALGKVGKMAVVGQEPIIDRQKFGETVAVNRGTNARVFTDMKEAFDWINKI